MPQNNGQGGQRLPLKVLARIVRHMDTRSDVDIFGDAIGSTGAPSDNNSRAFMPDMETITDSDINKLIVNDASQTSGLTFYRVLVPGFIYIHHWSGDWNPSGYLQVIVSNSSGLNPAYELCMSNGSGVDHVNNMFPIRPGGSTFIVLRGTISDKDTAACRKSVYFIPAWGSSRSGTSIRTGVSVAANSNGTIQNVYNPNRSLDDLAMFKACFE